MKCEKLSIVIDERQDQLDIHTLRTLYSAVEVPPEVSVSELSKEVEEFILENRITSPEKLHFSSLRYEQRLTLVELIGKMPIRIKMYVYYDFRKNQAITKKINLVRTVRYTQYKHRNKELTFYVEHAGEYKGVIRRESLTTDHFLSLVADCYCYVFAIKLNKPWDTRNNDMYTLIRHQIRLHTYIYDNKKIEDSKSNRI